MKIAIHHRKGSFSDRWVAYCEQQQIPFKLVNCYDSNIIEQLDDCSALMWHFHHNSAKDILFARQLLFAVESAGKKVFPNFHTVWHFDDKVGQKYLLEAVKAPAVNTYVFYNKEEALNWCRNTSFPKVFKLRGGAGSANVQLVSSRGAAEKLIRKAFGSGFKNEGVIPFSDIFKKFRKNRATGKMLAKSFVRTFMPTEFAKVNGRERGYVYFQDFIPNNDHDIRVVVMEGNAFALKRMTRENDFRASGSGKILFNKELFDEGTIKLSLDMAKILQTQCVAFDFVYLQGKPLLVEISYGFSFPVYDQCEGYWDSNMEWHAGPFNPYGWTVEALRK
ncbi:MAG: hypothetical protein RLY16_2447 [Bacteroidota bacterium]|jgi:glutathione synthase/RimK-type ligase-like ATP-grasp enzyme